MAYEASLKVKWDTQNAFDSARREAFTAGIEQERAKATKEIQMLKDEAEMDKLQSAKTLKALGALTNQQIADSLKLPLELVENL